MGLEQVAATAVETGMPKVFEQGALVSLLATIVIALAYALYKSLSLHRKDIKDIFAEVKGMNEKTTEALHRNANAITALSVHLESRRS